MAKTQENPRGTTFVALPEGEIDDIDDRTDEEQAFDEFVTGLGAEKMGELRVGKLKVAKDGTPLANTRSAHCFSCPIDQYKFSELLEFIRQRHGSGLFRIVGVTSGKRGVAFNKIVEIAEDVGPRQPQDSGLNNPQNLLESVGRIMAESQARTEGLIARLSERAAVNAAPATDPAESFMKMAAMFQGLITSMVPVFTRAAPTGGGEGDLLKHLETFARLKEVLGGGGEGGSDKESNFYDVVKAGLQSFGPALATLAVRGAQQNADLAALPAPGLPPGSAGPTIYANHQKQPAPPPRQENPAMASFKRQVDTLVMNAKNGVDPMQLAGTILDLTPDEKLDDLGSMLEAPDCIDKMAALNPEVQTYREFFEKLRTSILSLLDEGDADTLPQTPAGNSPGVDPPST